MAPKTQTKMPDFDPYEALMIEPTATDAEISRAYRKLALKFHPDKQRQNTDSKLTAEQIEQRFHQIKEARSFLLDVENAENRKLYDARRVSEQRRREVDKQREETMSRRRKDFRSELRKREEEARRDAANSKATTTSELKKERYTREQAKKQGQRQQDKQDVFGQSEKRKWKEYARQEQDQLEKQRAKEEIKRAKIDVEQRQVRLKWDRKKVKTSPSEDSIARMMSEFGPVETVVFTGSKGNTALVTFESESSCRPCVDYYADHKEMRAKFVGSRKDREERSQEEKRTAEQNRFERSSQARKQSVQSNDDETLEQRRVRQAREREALMRQMELEEAEGGADASINTVRGAASSTARRAVDRTRNFQHTWPPDFPRSFEYADLSTPLAKLQKAEADVLRELISADDLRRITLPTRT